MKKLAEMEKGSIESVNGYNDHAGFNKVVKELIKSGFSIISGGGLPTEIIENNTVNTLIEGRLTVVNSLPNIIQGVASNGNGWMSASIDCFLETDNGDVAVRVTINPEKYEGIAEGTEISAYLRKTNKDKFYLELATTKAETVEA